MPETDAPEAPVKPTPPSEPTPEIDTTAEDPYKPEDFADYQAEE